MSSHRLDAAWARRIKFRHLEMFLAVHEAGSITEAARLYHVSQPAMSRWLSETEAAMGLPLFVRRPTLSLTPAGEVLRRHAERVLGDAVRTSIEMRAVHAGFEGRLHIGTILSAAPELLPRAVARMQSEHPDIFVVVVEEGLSRLLERLERRELDAIVGVLDVRVRQSGFATEPLHADRIHVVGRPDHPFVRSSRPRWADAGRYRWILPLPDSVLRHPLDKAFADHGVTKVAASVQATSSLAVQMLLSRADYLTVLTDSVVRLYRAMGVVERVRLSPRMSFPNVGIIWDASQPNALVQTFIAAIRAEAKALSADR